MPCDVAARHGWPGTRTTVAVALVVGLLTAPIGLVRGQSGASAPRAEVRADLLAAAARQPATVQGGLGLNVPLGLYARLEVAGAAGRTVGVSPSATTGRVDVVGRFLLDPFRNSAWGISAGAGVSGRASASAKTRLYLLIVADVELPQRQRGLDVAIQAGVGGGGRIGVVLRRAGSGAR